LRWLTVLCAAVPAVAQAAPSILEDIAFASLPGGSFEVKLDFSGSPQQPTGYVIE
jgi:type IV pilus assembly protein PilQ